jgi:hypothetical protein
MRSAWAKYRQAQLKKHFSPLIEAVLMDYPSEPKIPRELLDGYLFAIGRSGLFGAMVRDAVKQAKLDKRFSDVDAYRALGEQFADVIAGTR